MIAIQNLVATYGGQRDNYYYYKSPETDAEVLAYYDEYDNSVILAFAGSDTALDWAYNSVLAPTYVDRHDVTVHWGFNAHRNSLLHKLYEWTFIRKARRIDLIGFSLGGATAILFAMDICQFNKPLTVTTIACPKVGFSDLTRRLANIPIVNYYYVNDPVHYIPCGYHLPGNGRNLGWKAVLCPHKLSHYTEDIIHYVSTLPKI